MYHRFRLTMLAATFAAGIGLMGLSSIATAAETLTKEQLIRMLQNSAQPRTLSREELERRLRNRLIIEEFASVDLEIYFKYDSSAITSSALKSLIPLGQALSDGRLSKGNFVIIGHTDAKGTAAYNLKLSQARAAAVRNFLLTNYGIVSGKLVAVGYGEEQLKNRRNPLSGDNRRVQIINLN